MIQPKQEMIMEIIKYLEMDKNKNIKTQDTAKHIF